MKAIHHAIKKNKHHIQNIVTITGLVGAFVGWAISIETRMAHQVPSSVFYKVIKDVVTFNNNTNKTLKDDTSKDIRFFRDRLFNLHLGCAPLNKEVMNDGKTD